MDSWTLQGDSYAFLHNTPNTFSLCHRDGTPNHVEIFDITSIPSQRSAISETTCLCDIFGDDCEPQSPSSSPASGPFVPIHREVERGAAVSPLVDDSSGSYHTAPGSSEGEEGFEDSKERLQSPTLHRENSEIRPSEAQGLSSGHSKEVSTKSEPESTSPAPQFTAASPLAQAYSPACSDKIPSPVHNGSLTASPGERASSSASSSVDTRSSVSSPNPSQTHSAGGKQCITPTFRGGHSSSSHQSSASPSPQPGVRAHSLSPDSANSVSLLDSRGAHLLPEPGSISHSHSTDPSPEPEPQSYSPDLTSITFEPRVIASSCSSPPSGTETPPQSRETSVSPELNPSRSPNTQASSPFSEPRGRVSLPDLLSRRSTPDTEQSPCTLELIPYLSSAGGDTTTTTTTTTVTDNQDSRLTPEPDSLVSTPSPRFTPPPPVASLSPTPEPTERSVSCDIRYPTPSPSPCSATSPTQAWMHTPSPVPSPEIRNTSLTSESSSLRTPSPLLSHNSAPSPGVKSGSSREELRSTAASPEIRITASSPEVRTREASPEVGLIPNSLDGHLNSVSPYPRSLSSSPHSTGIGYSLVQPEDRDSSPFPELSRLASPESGRAYLSADSRSPTPQTRDNRQTGRGETTHTSRGSPYLSSGIWISPQTEHTETTLSPPPGSQTPSPEPGYQPPPSERYQTPSPRHRQRDPSPLSPSPELRCSKHSPADSTPEAVPPYPQPSPGAEPLSSSLDITGIPDHTHAAEEEEPASSELTTLVAGISSPSPVVEDDVHSPEPGVSPLTKERLFDSPLEQRGPGGGLTPIETDQQYNPSLSPSVEEKREIGSGAVYNKPRADPQTPPRQLQASPQSPSPRGSPAYKPAAHSPVQRVKDPQPRFTAYPLHPDHKDGRSSLKPAYTPEHPGGKPPLKAVSDPREKLTENMAHHVHRRRTPSPPITRFTPVHIIAPEKPYRQWQNRSYSCHRAAASPLTGDLKTPVTARESPDVAPVDSYSRAHSSRLEREREMEREAQWEEERERERVMERVREIERGGRKEERICGKGEGRPRDAGYRGEQVELSFSARNRKGPVSRGTATASRETHRGMPTVNSYSENLLASRQPQQQQIQLRGQTSQQDPRGGGLSRRLQPTVPHKKSTMLGRRGGNRPRQSSSSSMGSELDDADDEVKWFTDRAFCSLSSPEVDYLDVYNSSHHSSANISQPSTRESPAGTNAALLAYADFRGSAQRLDNEDFSCQQPFTYYADGLDPAKRHEMGSFECVDVAVEREDSRKVRRGVPKRQIQLKRRSAAEMRRDESSENSSPAVLPASPSFQRCSKEAFVRQHSTPASMQDAYRSPPSPEPPAENGRKCKLQKSASLDETGTKTKLATCLIKSVLSKKMQSSEKPTEEQKSNDLASPSADKAPAWESPGAMLKNSPNDETHHLSSGCPSDHSLSPCGLHVGGEAGSQDNADPRRGGGVKCNDGLSPNTGGNSFAVLRPDGEGTESHRSSARSGNSAMRSELVVPFDSQPIPTENVPRAGGKQEDESTRWEETEDGDSANTMARNTGAPFATGAVSTQARMADRGEESQVIGTEGHKTLPSSRKSTGMSRTPEMTLDASPSVEKKKASLNVSLTPEMEKRSERRREAPSPETHLRERKVKAEARTGEGSEDGKAKVLIHKVRDVRKLVKNTYNLSFKATSAATPLLESRTGTEDKKETDEERREGVNEGRGAERSEERREARREVRVGEAGEERDEGRREEVKRELGEEKREACKDGKLPKLSPSPQGRGKPPSRPQPMQIECKAVCWKEDKSKMAARVLELESSGDKRQESPQLSADITREPESNSDASMGTGSTGDTVTAKPSHPEADVAAEPHGSGDRKTPIVGENEAKHEELRGDKKTPMLRDLPKLPSKDREVSTAVVVIRDGSSKTKASVSPTQDEVPSSLPDPSALPAPRAVSGPAPGSGGHLVSMLIKEKGYQADIGAVVGEGQLTAGGKGVPHKHVNRLEVPLQTCTSSEGDPGESRRLRTFSSSSAKPGPMADSAETLPKTREDEGAGVRPTVKDPVKQNNASHPKNTQQQIKRREQEDFEAVKRQDPSFPPKSPALRRFRPQPIEVKSLSKDAQKQDTPTNSLPSGRPQTIEVKSIANKSQKPVVPPKPNYKFKPTDFGHPPNETHKSAVAALGTRPQGEERPQTIVVSSPTIYRKLSNDITSPSNYARKIAVSTVSSCRPPASKTAASTIPSPSHRSAAKPETEASSDRAVQHQPDPSPQTSRYTQRPTASATTPTSATGTGQTSALGPAPGLPANHVPGSAEAEASQSSHSAVIDLHSQPQCARTSSPPEQAMPANTNATVRPAPVPATQAAGVTHTQQRGPRSLSSERCQRPDNLAFYASDDPPSYDDRESFSPLMLPDLTFRKLNRYQPSTRPPPCSCTTGCPTHPAFNPPHHHHHHSPHNLTPPAPSHSPGQSLPYPMAPPPHLRPTQCRPETQPMSYQPSSPKASPLGSSQPPSLYPSLHQPAACPPHPPFIPSCPADRPLPQMQHMDPRRPPIHRSPQQQPPGVGGGHYSDSHSPSLPPLDPQYLCAPQNLGPSYGSEYGGDTASVYSESNYGQTPRRVLMDPETGKYFYIEVPVQPLRKMLFDPEMGQYVEVLIPQQAMSHSGLYPPSAAPYPSLHNPSMYGPAQQYLPYAAPPHPQPPRHPDASVPSTMHQHGAGASYGGPSGQGPKPDPQTHPPLDQSYLEGMYYVPTGMNASPNPTPPDCYHKHPPSLPNTGGKRS